MHVGGTNNTFKVQSQFYLFPEVVIKLLPLDPGSLLSQATAKVLVCLRACVLLLSQSLCHMRVRSAQVGVFIHCFSLLYGNNYFLDYILHAFSTLFALCVSLNVCALQCYLSFSLRMD